MGGQVVIASTTSSDNDVDGVSIPEEPMALLYEVIPRQLWVGKCVILHKAVEILVAKGICCNIISNIMI